MIFPYSRYLLDKRLKESINTSLITKIIPQFWRIDICYDREPFFNGSFLNFKDVYFTNNSVYNSCAGAGPARKDAVCKRLNEVWKHNKAYFSGNLGTYSSENVAYREDVIALAKDRITPCLYYICAGKCQKGREAEHSGYCQKCDKYKPRIRERYLNQKKQKLDKIRRSEE